MMLLSQHIGPNHILFFLLSLCSFFARLSSCLVTGLD